MVCFIAVVWNQTYNIRGRPVFNAYCNQLDATVLSMAPTQCFAPKCWLNSYWIKLSLHHLNLNFLWFLLEKYFYLMLSHKLTRGIVGISERNNMKIFHVQHATLLQSCLTLCDPMDCNLPGSSVYGILPARILEWVAMPSSRGSSRSRDWTHIS